MYSWESCTDRRYGLGNGICPCCGRRVHSSDLLAGWDGVCREGDVRDPASLRWDCAIGGYSGLVNTAVSGSTSAQLIARMSTDDTPVLTAWGGGSNKKAFTVMIGTNDIRTGVSQATSYANIQNICSTMHAINSTPIYVFTILPSNIVPASGPDFETQRQALNTLIRNGGVCPYTVLDVGNDATIGQAGDQNNLTYFSSDGIHPTDAGQAIIANSYLLPALQSLGVH